MAERIPWTERTFNFDFPVALHHEILERIRGTPARVENLVRDLPTEILTRRAGDTWSIQENVGHLLNVEDLWSARLDDYDNEEETLRPADMSNRRTHQANHNAQSIEQILSGFRRERAAFVERLERLAPHRFGQTAMHPRLDRPMRIVDMMLFVAEHDDYHLARITQLTRQFSV
jgi:uncharacterized damage-inducible protein DinB